MTDRGADAGATDGEFTADEAGRRRRGGARATAGERRYAGDATAGDDEPEREVIDLLEPADGLPPVIATAEDLAAAVDRLAAGTGPVAVDAERASGYRYGQRAYLVQLRRAGAGTVLIDPIACPDLSGLGAALGRCRGGAARRVPGPAVPGRDRLPAAGAVRHRAGRRLLGYPRVALGTMLEEVLGFRLAKEHSAADWSVRPLPAEMLKYAALDVEVLTELRDALADQLDEQGKTEWARQEFAAIAAAPPPPPRADPWRRTSGIHKVRTRRALAVVRELWQTRDEIARDADLSPRRVLSDQAIVDAARAEAAKPPPTGRPQLDRISGFHARNARKYSDRWAAAVLRARELDEAELPEVAGAAAAPGPPPAHRWAERDPAAAARLAAARETRRRARRRRTGCPSRTCSRRTRCAAWPGNRRSRRPRRRSPRPCGPRAPAPGRRS